MLQNVHCVVCTVSFTLELHQMTQSWVIITVCKQRGRSSGVSGPWRDGSHQGPEKACGPCRGFLVLVCCLTDWQPPCSVQHHREEKSDVSSVAIPSSPRVNS